MVNVKNFPGCSEPVMEKLISVFKEPSSLPTPALPCSEQALPQVRSGILGIRPMHQHPEEKDKPCPPGALRWVTFPLRGGPFGRGGHKI